MRVGSPDGTPWEVDAPALRWRPRRRRAGTLDPVGLVVALLSLPLLALEWLAAALVTAVRPRHRVIARCDGPPERRYVWHAGSRNAAVAVRADVARRIAAGEDVAASADERHVGA